MQGVRGDDTHLGVFLVTSPSSGHSDSLCYQLATLGPALTVCWDFKLTPAHLLTIRTDTGDIESAIIPGKLLAHHHPLYEVILAEVLLLL